jgi:DNA-binding NarL/FixJ family response regulator
VTALVGVLLAEPYEPTRVGIRLALEVKGFEICCEPLDTHDAVHQAVSRRPPVCLIDERLPINALDAVSAIYRRAPETRLLLLTESDEPSNLVAAIRAGASGYLRKDLDPKRLPATIRGVLNGEAALSRRSTFQLMMALRTRERGRAAPTTSGVPLTDRELDVTELMTERLRTSEIAERLSISEVTVRRHISSAVTKLGVVDRAAAVAVLSGRSSA